MHMNKDVFHLLVTFSALLSFEDHCFLLNKTHKRHFFKMATKVYVTGI